MSTIHLKIKIKSLAAESRIIRREEKRHPGESYNRTSLYLHRIGIVRSEARAALLAYGYLRGKRYAQLEAKCHTPPDAKRTLSLINKYAGCAEPALTAEQFQEWHENNAPGRERKTVTQRAA
jgi:hypothetical protein